MIIAVRERKLLLQDKNWILYGLLALELFIFLNLFFIVPFLYGYNDNMYIVQHNLKTGNYLSLLQIFGDAILGAVVNKQFGAIITLVLSTLVGTCFYFISVIRNHNTEGNSRKIGNYALIVSVLATVLCWRIFPANYIYSHVFFLDKTIGSMQFAWRFLEIGSIAFCLVAAIGITSFSEEVKTEKYKSMSIGFGINLKRKFLTKRNILTAIVVTLAAIEAFLTIKQYYDYQSFDYLQPQNIADGPMYDYLKIDKSVNDTLKLVRDGYFDCEGCDITSWSREGTSLTFSYHKNSSQRDDNMKVVVPMIANGMEQARLENGEYLEICEDDRYQLCEILLPKASVEGTVIVSYKMPFVYYLCDLASGISLIIILFWSMFKFSNYINAVIKFRYVVCYMYNNLFYTSDF